jgi:hypothetical protein
MLIVMNPRPFMVWLRAGGDAAACATAASLEQETGHF